MAQLTWTSIKDIGSVELGESVTSGTGKNTFIPIPLPSPPVVSDAALLILAARNVHEERSYITINMQGLDPKHPDNVAKNVDLSFAAAKDQPYFISRILSTGSHFVTQVYRVPNGRLIDGPNFLGIHSRAADGTTNGNRDDFEVARIFLVYSTPD